MSIPMNKRANVLALVILCFVLASCASNKFEAQLATKVFQELNREDAYLVMGMVNKPGKFAADKSKDIKVSEAIQRAQGFAQCADKKYVVLRRGGGEHMQRIFINLEKRAPGKPSRFGREFSSGESRFDPVIGAGDVIIVEENVFSF